MFVKICGITNEDDALLAVAMGADAVGFIMAPSPRQIAPQRVFDITRRLPPEVLTVGVFKNELPERVIEQADRAGVKAVQLHGRETAEQTRQVAERFRWVIKVFEPGEDRLVQAAEYGTDMVMVDSPGGGTGKIFDWGLTGDVPEGMKLILAGGLNPENVATAIAEVEPWGVDVGSGVEREPGKKDPIKVMRFIEAAKAAAPEQYLGDDVGPYNWDFE
ncbi:MAG: phosphoribosylanthranilate isomerase [Ilumatobacter sp.]